MRRGLIDRPDPEARERRIAAAMFFATCCSVFGVYLLRWQQGSVWSDPTLTFRAMLFTGALLGFLLTHEIGHYAVARMHGFRLSLPWFLPIPFMIGTLGAIIRLKESPRTRTGLLEMGAAGPLAGVAVATGLFAVWLLGEPLTPAADEATLARPPVVYLLSVALTGDLPPAISTRDPLAFAAWIGCLITAMNLLPFGQLDGGHIFHALFPSWSKAMTWLLTFAMLAGAFVWPGWAVWAAMLHLMGVPRAVDVRRPDAPPSTRARVVGACALGALLLCFTPAPVSF